MCRYQTWSVNLPAWNLLPINRNHPSDSRCHQAASSRLQDEGYQLCWTNGILLSCCSVSNGIIDHEVCVVQATRHCKCHKPTYFYKSISAPGVSWYMFHIILSLVSLGLILTYASPHPVPDTYSKLKQLRCQPSARSVAQLVQSKVSDVWKSWMDQTNIRYLYIYIHLYTLPKTNSSPLKIDGWKMIFLLGWPIFRCCVSFWEGIWKSEMASCFILFFCIYLRGIMMLGLWQKQIKFKMK